MLFRSNLSAAAGAAGSSYTFTVRKNGTDTELTCTASATATSCSDILNSVSFAAGDTISISAVPSSPTQPTDNLDVRWSMSF